MEAGLVQGTREEVPEQPVRLKVLSELPRVSVPRLSHVDVSHFEHALVWVLSVVLIGLWVLYQLPSSILIIVIGLQLLIATAPSDRNA